MVNNAFVEPAIKERVEALLSRGGVAFNDFINGLLVEFIEENNIDEFKVKDDWEEFNRKMRLALDNDHNPPAFAVRSKKELAAKLEEGQRDFEEGRVYAIEEVIGDLNRDYGYHL